MIIYMCMFIKKVKITYNKDKNDLNMFLEMNMMKKQF